MLHSEWFGVLGMYDMFNCRFSIELIVLCVILGWGMVISLKKRASQFRLELKAYICMGICNFVFSFNFFCRCFSVIRH